MDPTPRRKLIAIWHYPKIRVMLFKVRLGKAWVPNGTNGVREVTS